MPIAHSPADGWFAITTDPDWPLRGAPDPISAGHAAHVQQQALATMCMTSPADYIVETFGETREAAETIVRNCQPQEDDTGHLPRGGL